MGAVCAAVLLHFWPYLRPLGGFQTQLSCGASSFVEDQTVKVLGQVREREFGLRAGNADGADEQAIAVLLVREDVLDPGADC